MTVVMAAVQSSSGNPQMTAGDRANPLTPRAFNGLKVFRRSTCSSVGSGAFCGQVDASSSLWCSFGCCAVEQQSLPCWHTNSIGVYQYHEKANVRWRVSKRMVYVHWDYYERQDYQCFRRVENCLEMTVIFFFFFKRCGLAVYLVTVVDNLFSENGNI